MAEGSSQIPPEVITKDLLVNVVQGEKWGSYRSSPLQLSPAWPSTTLTPTPTRIERSSTTLDDSAYAVAAYGLVHLAHATPGQTVLIHADLHAVNLEAVVRVAVLGCGLQTIVVKPTPQQAAMAQERFSTIAKDIAVFDSPLSNVDVHKVLQMTNGTCLQFSSLFSNSVIQLVSLVHVLLTGRGVDIVYNLTTSAQLQVSSRLLKAHGVYLEPNALPKPMALDELHDAVNVAPFSRCSHFSQT